jgi:hypothetical protein
LGVVVEPQGVEIREPQGTEGVEIRGVVELNDGENGRDGRDGGEGVESDIDPIIALQQTLKMNTLCLKAIPQNAIRAVADVYNRLLKTVIGSPNLVDNHARLLLFVPYVLAVKSNRKVKQCFQVKARANNYMSLSFNDILQTLYRDNQIITKKSYSSKPSLKSVKRLISFGRYGDAIKLMNSDGVHPITPFD